VLHDRPRYKPPAAVGRDRAWDKHYAEVFRFISEQDRFPKQLGSPHERSMQRWLHAQRLKLAAGELGERRRELLDALGKCWNK
jgi:hypothetical protein